MRDWCTFPRASEDGNGIITIDLNVDLSAVQALPMLYMIVRKTDDSAPLQDVYRLEEAIAEELEAGGLRVIGTLMLPSGRTMLAYGSEGEEHDDFVRDTVAKRHVSFAVESRQDPAWDFYRMLLPNAREVQIAGDLRNVHLLREGGDDLTAPRLVAFLIRFHESDVLAPFSQAAAHAGYDVAVDREGQLIACTRTMVPELGMLASVREQLTAIAGEFGGTYDGWTCDVTAPRKSS
jgi:hypothetical protein